MSVKRLWLRILAAALSVMAAAGGLLVAGTAHAQTVSSGSLSFSGDSGDYITQGDSYSYSTSNGDELKVFSSSGSMVRISVNAYNGDWWDLEFDAPGTRVLAPGTYSAAHRYPFNGTGPGLALGGEGRGCNELTGSFTVTKAVFGPDGYVQTFHATFEQHCEGGTPAARGEVRISNRPPPSAAAPKPATTTRSPSTTNRPRATTSPRARTTTPPAATASPSATPTDSPGALAAGSGNTAATDTDANSADANASARWALVKKAVDAPLLLIGVVIVVLVGLVAVGLVAAGLVLHVRGW
jgi:hypothetical protein